MLPSIHQLISAAMDQAAMDHDEYSEKLDELDHLLNDADVPMEPSRIWSLLADLTRHDLSAQPQSS
jgi:iron-sulfur cluster repair protein YtfE (RIC family)